MKFSTNNPLPLSWLRSSRKETCSASKRNLVNNSRFNSWPFLPYSKISLIFASRLTSNPQLRICYLSVSCFSHYHGKSQWKRLNINSLIKCNFCTSLTHPTTISNTTDSTLDRTQLYLKQAYSHIDNDRTEEALRCFDLAIDVIPMVDTSIYTQKASLLYDLGQYEEALQVVNQGLLMGNKDVDTFLYRAYILNQLSRYEEALWSFDDVLKIDPRCFTAIVDKARILSTMERFKESLELFELAALLDPHSYEGKRDLARALSLNEHFERAIEIYNSCLEEDESDNIVILEKTNALMELKKHQEALETLNEALINQDTDTVLLHNQGELLIQMGRYQEAIKSYEKMISIDPCHAKGHMMLANAFSKIGMLDKALKTCEKAISLGLNPIETGANDFKEKLIKLINEDKHAEIDQISNGDKITDSLDMVSQDQSLEKS